MCVQISHLWTWALHCYVAGRKFLVSLRNFLSMSCVFATISCQTLCPCHSSLLPSPRFLPSGLPTCPRPGIMYFIHLYLWFYLFSHDLISGGASCPCWLFTISARVVRVFQRIGDAVCARRRLFSRVVRQCVPSAGTP